GPFAYIPDILGNTVGVLDTATGTITATVPVGYGPFGVAVNPEGTRVYVANACDSRGACGDSAGTVSVIDTGSNTVTATVTVGNAPVGVAVNPSGTRVYVANFGADSVSVIDTTTNTVTATIGDTSHAMLNQPYG